MSVAECPSMASAEPSPSLGRKPRWIRGSHLVYGTAWPQGGGQNLRGLATPPSLGLVSSPET